MSLPPPPGSCLVTLPRRSGDKPQETFVAVNPRDPLNAVISYHQAIGEGGDHHPSVRVQADVAWTDDGGQEWTVAGNTSHTDFRLSIDTAAAFDLHGNAFLIYIGMDEVAPPTRHGEYVLRSRDGGRRWDAPLALIEHRHTLEEGRLEHMPKLAADIHAGSPYAGNVYAVWDRFVTHEVRDGKFVGREHTIITRSVDGGKTWATPRTIAEHLGLLTQGVAVGGDGAVYVMNVPGELPPGGTQKDLTLMVSRDGGLTFDPPLPIVRTTLRAVADFARPNTYAVAAIAVDPRSSPGKLFVVYQDHPYGDRDVMCTTSDDGGHTWTPPVRVNDDRRSNGKDQLIPWLAVDPTDGAAYVVFYDRRDDPGNVLSTVTLARSTDGGRTFTNYAWSDVRSDARIGCLGDYIGIAAMDGRVYGAWVENAPPEEHVPGGAGSEAASGGPSGDNPGLPWGPTVIRVGIADFRKDDAE